MLNFGVFNQLPSSTSTTGGKKPVEYATGFSESSFERKNIAWVLPSEGVNPALKK